MIIVMRAEATAAQRDGVREQVEASGGRSYAARDGNRTVLGCLGDTDALSEDNVEALRGGAFKPRTSRYAFQGLGLDALRWLAEVRRVTGLPVVTEVLDPRQVELVAAHADVLQVGARSMQNFPLLAEVGRVRRPVL